MCYILYNFIDGYHFEQCQCHTKLLQMFKFLIKIQQIIKDETGVTISAYKGIHAACTITHFSFCKPIFFNKGKYRFQGLRSQSKVRGLSTKIKF